MNDLELLEFAAEQLGSAEDCLRRIKTPGCNMWQVGYDLRRARREVEAQVVYEHHVNPMIIISGKYDGRMT